jgi:hypothetical protein
VHPRAELELELTKLASGSGPALVSTLVSRVCRLRGDHKAGVIRMKLDQIKFWITADVRYWHLADIDAGGEHVCFWG